VDPDALAQARGLSPVEGVFHAQCMDILNSHLGCPWVPDNNSGKLAVSPHLSLSGPKIMAPRRSPAMKIDWEMSFRSFLSHTRSNWRRETQLLLLSKDPGYFLWVGSPSAPWWTQELGAQAASAAPGSRQPTPKDEPPWCTHRTQVRGRTGV